MSKIKAFTEKINYNLDPATIIMIIYYCIKLYLECKKTSKEIREDFQSPGLGMKILLSRTIRNHCPTLKASEQLTLRSIILSKVKGLTEDEIEDILNEYTTSM